MARIIAFIFLLLPLIEIALFVVVGRAIGLLPTLALVILAAIAGALLLRHQGLGVINRLRSNVSAGTIPGRTMFDGLLIGIAALFLVLPGFLSDVVALALLVPAVRGWIFSALAGRFRVVETTTSYRHYDGPVYDQEVEIKTIDYRDEDGRDRQN